MDKNIKYLLSALLLILFSLPLFADPIIGFASTTVYDFYDGNRLLNPGEFVWLELEITNHSDSTFEHIYGVPDRNFDPYVHPDSNYFFDTRLDRDNAPLPGETMEWDDLECYIASDTPEGYTIRIPVAFFNDDNSYLCTDTIRVPVYGTGDHDGPFFDAPSINTYSLSVGDTIVMSGKCWEAGNILNVEAIVNNAQGTPIVIIDLYDDGTHKDTLANDHVYTGFWIVNQTGDFTVDFKGWDVYQNVGTHERFLNYTSHPFEPGDFEPVLPTGISHAVIIQNATINGLVLEAGDMIGVFDGELCVGAATYEGQFPVTIPAWMEYSLPGDRTLQGARYNEEMSFRIRQNATGLNFTAEANYHDGNGIFNRGVTVVEHLATQATHQTIALKPNQFNLISLNINPIDASAQRVFNDIKSLRIVRDDSGQFFIPEYDIDTIGELAPEKGYQVLYAGDLEQSITNTGTPLNPSTLTLTLSPDQCHLIAFPYQLAFDATQVFKSIAESILILHDDRGGYWIPDLGINSLGVVQPGQGLQIYVKESVSFTYPELAKPLGKNPEALNLSSQTTHFQFTESGLSKAFVIESSEFELKAGDEVAVFDGKMCVGASVFSGAFPLLIAAWAGDQSYDIPGYKIGNPISLHHWTGDADETVLAVEFKDSDHFDDSPLDLIQLKAKQETYTTATQLPTQFQLSQNYPNPFNGETVIEYSIPSKNMASLTIYNTNGQLVKTLLHEVKQPGAYVAKWNGQNENGLPVQTGLYLITLRTGKHVSTRKMLLTQ